MMLFMTASRSEFDLGFLMDVGWTDEVMTKPGNGWDEEWKGTGYVGTVGFVFKRGCL